MGGCAGVERRVAVLGHDGVPVAQGVGGANLQGAAPVDHADGLALGDEHDVFQVQVGVHIPPVVRDAHDPAGVHEAAEQIKRGVGRLPRLRAGGEILDGVVQVGPPDELHDIGGAARVVGELGVNWHDSRLAEFVGDDRLAVKLLDQPGRFVAARFHDLVGDHPVVHLEVARRVNLTHPANGGVVGYLVPARHPAGWGRGRGRATAQRRVGVLDQLDRLLQSGEEIRVGSQIAGNRLLARFPEDKPAVEQVDESRVGGYLGPGHGGELPWMIWRGIP